MKHDMQRNQGFTVIELMAVVAIISILAVLALAAYSDYTIRSKVSEGMTFAGEAKTSVREYYYHVGKMPRNNGQAGLVEAEEYDQFNFIEKLEVSTAPTAGSIAITFSLPGTSADNKQLWLVPRTQDRVVYWECYPPDEDGISRNQAPPNCRGG
mgnify:CR=1 FL=1